jgi:cytosine/adenosine deaminase-related metal-dependent hydrolase
MKSNLLVWIILLIWMNSFIVVAETVHSTASDSLPDIGVIELRNYLLKPGMRDKFTHYFETNLIAPQEESDAYPLGQYNVKEALIIFSGFAGFVV